MAIIGKRLKTARENAKLTQMNAAKKLGVSNGTLSGYERNYRDPDTDILNSMANLYGVSVEWLMGRTNEVSKSPQPSKDERDIAKKLESILGDLDNTNSLAFNGEPMDDNTRDLVRAQIESNLRVAKEMARKKFTPKKYQTDDNE